MLANGLLIKLKPWNSVKAPPRFLLSITSSVADQSASCEVTTIPQIPYF